MEFYAQNKKHRPIRLSYKTRKFAYDSLNKKYGLDTLKTHSVTLDDIPDFENVFSIDKYDIAIKRIAEQAPIRICDGEKISGAATFGLAIEHYVPATYNNTPVFSSVSHLTVNFEKVLKEGISSIKLNAERSLEKYKGTDKERFIKSCLNCLSAFEVYHSRYLKALENLDDYKANYDNLKRVPFKPATNFYEAVQSLWFTFSFIRLCGNWPGIGRLDYLLGEYLQNDLNSGKITLIDAREILAHFFIKGCEWINGQYIGSGDAQHYQNIILCGIDENGKEVTNEVTYLVLDIIEELGISDFPTSIRINETTEEKLLRRVAEVMQFGGGTLAVYNENLVIDALIKDGYSVKEARNFTNDGCWEVQIPGKTFFIYSPFDALQILQRATLYGYDNRVDFASFEDLYGKFIKDLHDKIESIFLNVQYKFLKCEQEESGFKWIESTPCTVVSLFEDGCIEKGASYYEGGPIYNLYSPHLGGLADTVNSLYAIKKLVFDQKKISFKQFVNVLKNDWNEQEVLRQYVLNNYDYFGNDNDEVDLIASRVLSDFADICTSFNGKCGYKFPAGVSTFGRQLEWSKFRLASPHGRRIGEILSANCSPTPNTDKEGATAIIRSYCKADLSKLSIGAALDIKLLPSSVSGEIGVQTLVSLMQGFVKLGGFFMQPDVVDSSMLKLAQENPQDYQNLSVRVSGWNARFVTLDKQWQQMVIEQNEH